MAALQSCRLVAPSPAAFAASGSVRPPSRLACVQPAGRRERCFPGLSLSLRQCQPAAPRPRVAVRAQSQGGGAQPAARFFVAEREHVMSRYRDIVDIDHGCLYMEATAMSGQVCLAANEALKIASSVMDTASTNLGAPNEISTDTVHRTVRAYANIFRDAADAAYSRTVSRKTVTAFLGALRGLASISHILLDAALEALSHAHPRESLQEYAFNRDVEAMRQELNQLRNDLEDASGRPRALR